RLALADHDADGGTDETRLVIGDAKAGRAVSPLDQVYDPPQPPAALEHRFLAGASRVTAGAAGQTKGQLERERLPRRLCFHRLLQPRAETDAEGLDFVAPHALDGGRELFVVLRRYLVERGVEHVRRRPERARRDGQSAALLESAKTLGLDLVEQAAARQRI